MPNSVKEQRDERILMALACGSTIEQAAAKGEVTAKTVQRRMQEPDFRKRLHMLRSEMVSRAASMLTAAALEAVKTLLSLQNENVQAAVRLGAAKAVLELGAKLRENVELEERIRQLEEKFGDSVLAKPTES
jgi:hypothetical protein